MSTSLCDMPIVNGATRLYGIIGDPIAQVKSPEVMTARFRAAHRNALLLPLHVLPDRFDETMRGMKALANMDGIIITVPYKARIVPFADRLLPTGERVGAINAMRRDADGRWSGDMFDGKGMVGALRRDNLDPRGLHVMLLGAGGAGSAVADALADAGAAAITLFDKDEAKARHLASRLTKAHAKCAVRVGPATTEGHDLLVNATPVGMAPGDGLPAELGTLDPTLIVFDVIIKSHDTPLLHHARSRGCRVLGGRAMLEGQAEELARFFGITD